MNFFSNDYLLHMSQGHIQV